MFGGFNVTCTAGNKNIPNGYIFHPDTDWNSITTFLDGLLGNVSMDAIRSIIWLVENEQQPTSYLHIPLWDTEVNRIYDTVKYVLDNYPNIMYYLSMGPMWAADARSVLSPDTMNPRPNNPFKSLQELGDAIVESFDKLLNKLKDLPVARLKIDLFNELCSRTQPENMQLYALIYAKLARLCIDAKIDYTVSTIIDTDGKMQRARDTYRALMQIQRANNLPFFNFAECHVNGFSDAVFQKRIYGVIRDMKNFVNRPVFIGEVDLHPMSFKSELEMLNGRPQSICYWTK